MDKRIIVPSSLSNPPPVSFAVMNSLIMRPPTHHIAQLRPGDKNLELQFILLGKIESIITKKGQKITKFLIADRSAAIHFNIFGEMGDQLREGDICYVNGVYCATHQDRTLLYQGKGTLRILDRHNFIFTTRPNISQRGI